MDITKIEQLIEKLSRNDKILFNRFYSVRVYESKSKVQKKVISVIKRRFGSIKKIEYQEIVCINNNLTGEGSLFNKLRSSRPMRKIKINMHEFEKKEGCFFCDIMNKTPEDIFGRIKGKYCMTASNLAKYDYFHGLIIFNEHNPFKIKKPWLKDYLEVAYKWFKKVENIDRFAKYHFLIWNHLWKAGASIVHGHMQITSSKIQYGKIKKFEEIVSYYKRKYKSNYFLDLFKIHKNLGLGRKVDRCNVLFYLTPIKEKEIFIFTKEKSFIILSNLIYKIIQNYIKVGVQSFNLALFKIKDYWIVRIVDRGRLENSHCDIGSMELYGNSVISTDPFVLASKFKL